MSDPIPESDDSKRIREAVRTLSEFFDVVQIFATNHNTIDGSGTRHYIHGAGNYFARYGVTKIWIDQQDEKTRHDLRKAEDEGN